MVPIGSEATAEFAPTIDSMKIAFHFDSDHPDLGGVSYGWPSMRLVFSALLAQRRVHITSKIFVGDVSFKSIDTSRDGRHGSLSRTDILESWQHPHNSLWNRLLADRVTAAFNVYAICFESVDENTAERLHAGLVDEPSYIGAIEVDDSSPLHWRLYPLVALFRVLDRGAQVFWDGISEDQMDPGLLEDVRSFGFNPVSWESLSGRFSIFDPYHDFEHAKRVAEFKRDGGQLLGFVADSVVSILGDAVPDLGDRLWSAFRTFDQAETTEQLSQVAATCRRIIEHVADHVFPPTETVAGGPKLGPKNYRNRLLAFADQARCADTAIDLVSVSTNALNEQINKLLDVAHKGIHAEIYRTETRRCLLRTILLLDDLVALKQGSFPIRLP